MAYTYLQNIYIFQLAPILKMHILHKEVKSHVNTSEAFYHGLLIYIIQWIKTLHDSYVLIMLSLTPLQVILWNM